MSHCTCSDLQERHQTTRKETGFLRLINPRSWVQAAPAPARAIVVGREAPWWAERTVAGCARVGRRPLTRPSPAVPALAAFMALRRAALPECLAARLAVRPTERKPLLRRTASSQPCAEALCPVAAVPSTSSVGSRNACRPARARHRAERPLDAGQEDCASRTARPSAGVQGAVVELGHVRGSDEPEVHIDVLFAPASGE